MRRGGVQAALVVVVTGALVGGTPTRTARAEVPYFLQPSLDVGITSVQNTVSFGKDLGASGYGVHLTEWNGFITKTGTMLVIGWIMDLAIKRADVEWSSSTSIDTYDRTSRSATGELSTSRVSVTRRETTFKITPRPPEEIAAQEAARDDALGNVALLPMHTDVLFLPERDDGSLRGIRGTFYVLAFPVAGWLEIATGLYGARFKADLEDPMTGELVRHRHRAAGIPLRVTLAPLTWAQITVEGFANLAGINTDDDGIDRSSSVRGTLTLALPFTERGYARAGLERTRLAQEGTWGTFIEAGLRF